VNMFKDLVVFGVITRNQTKVHEISNSLLFLLPLIPVDFVGEEPL
jgi:hypothetical protein